MVLHTGGQDQVLLVLYKFDVLVLDLESEKAVLDLSGEHQLEKHDEEDGNPLVFETELAEVIEVHEDLGVSRA